MHMEVATEVEDGKTEIEPHINWKTFPYSIPHCSISLKSRVANFFDHTGNYLRTLLTILEFIIFVIPDDHTGN